MIFKTRERIASRMLHRPTRKLEQEIRTLALAHPGTPCIFVYY